VTSTRVGATPVDGLTRAGFRALARLRQARAFHPVGVAFHGIATTTSGAPRGLPSGEWPAVVRFSRGAGLPEPLPDLLGIGVRLEGAADLGRPFDLLMTSTGSGRLTRHVLRPARTFGSGRASTLLPYAGPDGSVVLSVRVTDGQVGGLADVRRRCGDPTGDGLTLELSRSDAGGGWVPFGQVHVRGLLDEADERALDLDPFHTGPDLVPSGLLNRLRRPAYGGSREGRGAP
jgi:hypothetical protein